MTITDLRRTDLEWDDEPIVITEPGVYDIPAEDYHADPVPGGSLSHSGAKKLLPPSCPALFDHERRNPPAPKEHLEFGTAVHTLVFGSGAKPVLVDAPNWQTRAAQGKRREIREGGEIPLLPHEMEKASEMATMVRRDPIAAGLLNPRAGSAEQSLFWQDQRTGIWRRARLDYLPNAAPDRRIIVPDYKTATALDDESVAKAIQEHGYHTQADWYLDGVRSLGLAQDATFLFVFQLKSPPHLVRVVGVPESAMAIAAAKNRRAVEIYAECSRTGRWPGFGNGIDYIELPGWAEYRDAQEYL